MIPRKPRQKKGEQQAPAPPERTDSGRMLATLMGNLPGMVYRCRNDHDWTMEFASEGCLALTGYAPDDFLAGNVSYGKQLIHPDDQERVWNEVQVALGERRPFQLTYRIVTRQGQKRGGWGAGGGGGFLG